MAIIEIPESVKVWKIGDGAANIKSWNNYTNNQGYNLFCRSNGKYLTWQKVPLGINLGFTDDVALRKTHFRLPDGSERDILSGESVAFGIGGGEAFLQYAHRDVGINLKWNKNPVCEWRIFGSNNQTGAPIAENSFVALVNDRVKPSPDFFIYFNRPSGMADVGWTSSPEFWNSILNFTEQQIISRAKTAISGGVWR
jgi:hypothetical protein